MTLQPSRQHTSQCPAGTLTCNYIVRSWNYRLGPEAVHITQAKFFSQRKAISQRQFHFRHERQKYQLGYIAISLWFRVLSWNLNSGHSQQGGTQWTQTCKFSIHIPTYWCTLSVQEVPAAIIIIIKNQLILQGYHYIHILKWVLYIFMFPMNKLQHNWK